MAITKFNVVEGLTVGDLVQIPVIDNTANVSANNLTVQGNSNLGNYATANFFVGNGSQLTGITLSNTLADVQITSPTLGQTLAYNGLVWVNTTTGSVSAGQGVDFFFTGPQIIAQTANNFFELDSLSASPNATATTISQAINNTTQVIAAGRSNVLNRTKIDGGAWDVSVYGNVDATTGTNSLRTAIFYIENPNCTFTMTGTGTTRTVTASTGSPFANITASATITSASFLETPTGVYQISAKTSNTIVTIDTPNGYTNESAVAGYVYNPYILFDAKTIISTSISEYVFSASAVEQAISTTDRVGFFLFGTTTTSRTLYVTLGGTSQGTHITTPLATLHDDLAGLQGGQASEYYHLTFNEYAGTGTGNFVRQSNANLITPNIDSAIGLSLNLTGNLISGNANLGNLVTANFITGTLTTGSQPNITSLGNLSSLTSNGTIDFTNATNVSLGNVSNLKISGGSLGYVLKTDGAGNLSWGIDTTAAAGTNTQVQFNNSNNLGASANFTFDTSTSLLTVIGNINSENADLGNLVQANYFSGDGYLLSNINAANVNGVVANANYASFANVAYNVSGSNVSGQVANALVAGTVYTNSQPNITSVGTLSSLSVNGNVTAGNITSSGQLNTVDAIVSGNLTVNGNTIYANVTTLNVKDPVIEMGGNPNGDPLTSNDGKDRGTLLHYYSGAAIDAFMGWDNSNSEFAFGSNVTLTNDIVTWNELGNIRANYFLGNASQLTGTIANANYASFAGTVTTNSQPNITSLGSLSSLTVTGNLSSGNANLGNTVTANFFSGDGSLLSNLNVANIGTVANANYAAFAGNVTIASQPNITSLGTLVNLTVTGNITAGNANLGNLTVSNYFSGNGSLLSSITGGNVTGQVGNSLIAGTVYTNSQPNITSVGTLNGLVANATIDFINATNVSLGNVSNVKILGGSSGYVLKTDGTGNLSWGIDTTAAAGSNTQVQFNNNNNLDADANFIYNKSTQILDVLGTVAGYVIRPSIGSGANGIVFPNNPGGGTGDGASIKYYAYSSEDSVLEFTVANDANDYIKFNSPGGVVIDNNITANNANLGNLVTANYFSGNGSLLTSLTGGNVTGQVGNALISGTVYTNAQPNITSLGTLSSLNVTGNITSGNATLGNLTISNYFSGNGSLLSSITGANVTGTVPNANYSVFAGTVIAQAQPNITSVGNLSGLTVSGNATVAGNFVVSGTTIYANVTTFNVKDPIIEVGGTGNNDPLSANDGKDRGMLLHYFITSPSPEPVDAFMGWDNGNSEFAFGSNVTVTNELVTYNQYGNIRANYFLGNASQLTGTIANANYASFAGTVTTNAQPNITSLGTLSSLTITGNVTSGNASLGNLATANFFSGNGSLLSSITGANVTGFVPNANVANTAYSVDGSNVTGQVANALVAGTVYTNAQPNITSVGTLTSLIVSGNASFSGANTYFANVANIKIPGGSNGYVLKTDGTGNLSWGIDLSEYSNTNVAAYLPIYTGLLGGTLSTQTQPNITSLGNLSSLNVTGNISSGNANLGNLAVANFFSGNGSLLTSLTGGNVTGQVGNSLIAGTVYTNSQPNITSVGTLSSLTVSGNASFTGSNTYIANIANLIIPGGSNGYVLKTDGAGNLSWGLDTTDYSNTNVAAYLPTYTGLIGGTLTTASQPNVTSVGTLSSLSVTGNISSGNSSLGNLAIANFFSGNGSLLTSITGGNVTGQVGNALIAGTVYTNAQPNITSLGTLSNLNVSGNAQFTGANTYFANVANIKIPGGSNGYVLKTDGAGNLSWGIDTTDYSNTNVAAYLPTYTGLIGGTLTTASQPNVTSLGTLASLNVTGNISAGNANLGNLASANFFSGNGSLLTSITGANVTGQVGNALVAGTVYTNSQPNITSLGTLNGLTVSGNASFSGSNTYIANVANLKIPGGSNGYVLKTDGAGNLSWGIDTTDYSNTNVAAYLPTYTGLIGGTLTTASQPNVTSLGTLASLNVTGNITTGNANLGNLASANFISGNGSLLSSITGGNVTGQVGNALVAGTVYTNSQPNITSLGTLTSLNVTGNISSGNSNLGNLAVANYFSGNGSLLTSITAGNINGQVANALVAGTVYTNSQPNITSIGTLSSLTVTGLITATGTGIKTSNIQDSLGTVTITTGHNSVSGDVGVYGNLVVGTSGAGNVTAYNANLGNLVTASYFTGNGSLLTSITGANVTGQVGNALVAGTVYTNAQPNITSLGTLSNLSVTANISAGNISATGTIIGTAVTANYVMTTLQTTGTFYPTFVSNNASGNYALAANANISFDVANSTLNVPKILSGTGNGGSITGANLISANYFQGDGSLLTNLNISNASVSNANYASFAGNVINSAQPNITSLGNLSSLTVTGNISAGNLLTDNLLYANGVAWSFGSTYSNTNVAAYLPTYTGNVSANYFIGNGALLTDITGSNVTGQVGNSLIAGTVYTNAQPNITSLGSLVNLTVSGNATIAGDLTVSGNTVYANVTTLNVKDPIIELGGTGNNDPLTSNDGKDRGTLLHYYTTSPVDAFMGWDNSNGEFGFGSNVTSTNEVITWNSYGNIRANYIYGNGAFLTGLPEQYGNSNVANYLPTYTGNLSAGNITGANLISGNFITGTLTTNSQPNITSLGTLTNLSVTGNVTAGNLTSNSLGNQQIAISLNGLLVGGPDLLWEFNNAALYAKNIKANGAAIIDGNVTSLNANLGNLATANYFSGNGSLLTSITGGNVVGQVGNALVAGTVYTNSQPNITSVGTLSNLSVTSNVSAGNILSDNLLYANGTPYIFTTNAAGSNTQVQFNDGNLFAGSTAFTFDKGTNTLSVTNFTVANVTANAIANLGSVSNVKITGGTAGYLLSTDGLGNLSWTNAGAGSGSGFVNIIKNSFVGDGSNATFNLATIPSSEEAIMVNIDGLLQQDSVYSVSGSQVIFATPPLSGVKIEVTIFGAVPITTLNTQVLFANGSNVVGSGNFTFNNTTNTLSVTNVTSSSNVSAGNIKTDNLLYANGTPYVFTTNAAGSNTQVQFNDGNSFAGSANFTFDKTTNTLSVTNIIGNGAGITYITGSNVNGQVGNALISGTVYTNSQPNITSLGTLSSLSVTGNVVAGNLESTSGTATLGSGVISVSTGNAGIFASGIGNINLGLAANITIGSTTGNVVVQGRIGANLFYSNRAAIVVTTNTVIDSFTTTEYRSAKYTMRVNSDDGYQTAEVLLVHNGTNSFVTIYGTLSTIGTDIITLSTDINSGNVRLLATTGSPNTTVKVLGTYVPD